MMDLIYEKPKVTAEIGCNHKGNLTIAKELIDIAKDCGADVAKFQKRDPKTLLTERQYNASHPNPYHSYGKTYGEHREFLEFNLEQHKELKDYCTKKGILYSTSVWDIVSAKNIISLNPEFIKIPSASNNNIELLKYLRDNYNGDIHVSLGMTTKKEEEAILKIFNEKEAKKRLILYACTSGYPVPFDKLFLLEIQRLFKSYASEVKGIGFSGHHLGIAIDIAAYVLGASWIERHFTKDRTWKGTDHAASLEPPGLSKLIRDLKATYEALKYRDTEIVDIEKPQREKLKFKK